VLLGSFPGQMRDGAGPAASVIAQRRTRTAGAFACGAAIRTAIDQQTIPLKPPAHGKQKAGHQCPRSDC
jgi:hypothetical protein